MSVELSIVIPTYNGAPLIEDLLRSLQKSVPDTPHFEIIINDDPSSSDNLQSVVDRYRNDSFDIIYARSNTARGVGRNRGAELANAPILLHLDSDMQVSPTLIRECVKRMDEGADALIIPEESFGTTFWAKCRWLEKRIYDGLDEIEALRCVRRDVYERIGGHNEAMIFAEDKDLDLRVRATGARVERTSAHLRHNEGAPTLRSIMQKKRGYAATSVTFASEHQQMHDWQVSPIHRVLVLFRKPKLVVRHPLLFTGILMVGACELVALRTGKTAAVNESRIAAEPRHH